MEHLPEGFDLRAFDDIWRLSPPGTRLRLFTDRIPVELAQTTGPEQAHARAVEILGVDPAAVASAALAVKTMAGEIDTLLHAVGLLASLSSILVEGERIEVVSVAHDGHGTRARNSTHPGGDLVTNLRVAEFTFVRWNPKGSNGTRERKVVGDLLKLASDPLVGDRERYLYAGQGHLIEDWLGRSRATVEKHARHYQQLDGWAALGEPRTVRDLWELLGPEGDGPTVRVEHLPDLVDGLADLLPLN